MTAQTKCNKCGVWVDAFSLRHVCKPEDDLVYRLKKRAEIRRQIPGRKSVETGEADRIADLLDEAADRITELERCNGFCGEYECKENQDGCKRKVQKK